MCKGWCASECGAFWLLHDTSKSFVKRLGACIKLKLSLILTTARLPSLKVKP